MRIKEIDLWIPVWWIGGIALAMTGHISWWVFVLVVASRISVKVTR